MAKAIKTSPKAAYETFPGMSADEAADKGFVIVESGPMGESPVYGRYLNTTTGAALETLKDKDDRVASPAGGAVAMDQVGTQKGALINPNDPVIHGQGDTNPHEDGAAPLDSTNEGLLDIVKGFDPANPDEEASGPAPKVSSAKTQAAKA